MIGDDLVMILKVQNTEIGIRFIQFGEEDSTLTPKPISSPKDLLEKLQKEALFSL